MVDNMNDKDIMNIVDEIFEELEVHDIIEKIGGESSDKDQALSDDSDCISNCYEDLTENSEKIVANSQLMLNKCTKLCAIYFYYSTGGALAV